MRRVECSNPFGRHAEESFRAPATLRRGFAQTRFHVSLRLEPVERCVNCADGYVPVSPRCDVLADRDSVRAVVKPQEREQNDVFEFPEIAALRHKYDIIE